MFSGRHFVHSVIPAARTLASNLSFPDLQEMMAQRTPTIPRVSSGQSDSRHRFTRRTRVVTGRR